MFWTSPIFGAPWIHFISLQAMGFSQQRSEDWRYLHPGFVFPWMFRFRCCHMFCVVRFFCGILSSAFFARLFFLWAEFIYDAFRYGGIRRRKKTQLLACFPATPSSDRTTIHSNDTFNGFRFAKNINLLSYKSKIYMLYIYISKNTIFLHRFQSPMDSSHVSFFPPAHFSRELAKAEIESSCLIPVYTFNNSAIISSFSIEVFF